MSNNNEIKEVAEAVLGVAAMIGVGVGLAAIAGPIAAVPFVGIAASHIAHKLGHVAVTHGTRAVLENTQQKYHPH